MNIFNYIKAHRDFFAVLNNNGLDRITAKEIDIYDDFQALREDNVLYDVAMNAVMQKYGIGRSTIQRIVNKYSPEVEI
jgi:poly-beta-hydroxyalkanoate depolymerase